MPGAEQEAIDGKPDHLERDIALLRADQQQLATKLAELQMAESAHEKSLRELETQLAAAAEQLSVAREARAGAEARAENQDQRRVEMGRISGERFECPPPVLPGRESGVERIGFTASGVSECPWMSSKQLRRTDQRPCLFRPCRLR
jgi:chromosome segregation protein